MLLAAPDALMLVSTTVCVTVLSVDSVRLAAEDDGEETVPLLPLLPLLLATMEVAVSLSVLELAVGVARMAVAVTVAEVPAAAECCPVRAGRPVRSAVMMPVRRAGSLGASAVWSGCEFSCRAANLSPP